MNIWYLSAYDQPKGQSSRTYDFSIELVNRGHQVTMFTNSYCHFTHLERLSSQEKWRIEEIDGIKIVWLKTIHYTGNGWRRGANMISNIWRSIQVARNFSEIPDIVIGPSVPLGTGWAAYKIAKMKGAVFVFEVRDIWPIALVDNGVLSKKNPVYYLFRFIEKYLYSKSYHISAVLPYTFRHVIDSGGNPEKVTWIPNGVNFDRFSGFEKYGGEENHPLVVMYIGGFGVAHDVITIVRAANILQQRGNDNFRFVLIGDGVKKPACQHEASLYALSNIEFRDQIPKSAVPMLQMEADILIACVTDSPIYRFGMNLNKIYDYLASGRPIIFSGNAPNDPITESGAGFSVPPENPEMMVEALGKFLDMSLAERIEMGQRGREYVEREFDMSVLGKKMEQMLLDVVRKRRDNK